VAHYAKKTAAGGLFIYFHLKVTKAFSRSGILEAKGV